MQVERDLLGQENECLAKKLCRSKADYTGLSARVKELLERLRRMEEEDVQVSRLLLES